MKKNKTLITLLTTGGVIVILIISQRLGILTSITTVLTRAFSPLVRIAYQAGSIFSPESGEGMSTVELQAEMQRLEAENRDLLTQQARWSEIEQENNSLKKILQYKESIPYSLLTAGVIGHGVPDSTGPEQTITLDQGSSTGIQPGFPILDTEGVLIGKITETKDSIAEGCLLFKENCRVAVSLKDQPGTIGVIQSDLSLALKIDFIPHNRTIEVGQIVVTSGLEEKIPAGLVVGRISQIIKDGNELWQHALIEPIGNFNTLKIVGVIVS